MPAHLIGIEGPQKGLLLLLDQGDNWVIGRDPKSADYVVEDATVSRKHSRISKTNEGFLIRNLSKTNPILINGQEIRDPVVLAEGDLIQIGSTTFRFSEQEIPEDAHLPPKKTSEYDAIFGDLESEAPSESAVEEPTIQELPPKEETAYDTIFESGEEDLPLNLLSPAPLILKVISGPNTGAEIGIEKGNTYILGKDPNSCDIVFQDLSVSRNHAKLIVAENGETKIEDLGSKNKTLLNGFPVEGEKTITSQDIVSLGTTAFLVIDREAPQETIYAAPLPQTQPAVIEEELGEIQEESWKSKPIPTKHLVMAGAAAAIFLIVFLSFFSLFRSEPMEIAVKEPSEQISDSLKKFEDVQFSFNSGSGKLFLVGHVLTSVDYQEMNYQLSQLQFISSVENTVVIDELVWRSTNDVLAGNSNWRGVSVAAAKPGHFIVNGYLQTNQEAVELSDYLNVNFPYIDRLENKVVVEENLNVQLQSMLQTHGFSAVSVQLSNGDLIVAGRYNEAKQREFEKLLKELNQIHGIAKVQNFAIATTASNANIDITKDFKVDGSALHDGKGYSIVLNGKIYTVGDFVEGLKITEIDQNIVLLEKEGLKYKIDYGRK